MKNTKEQNKSDIDRKYRTIGSILSWTACILYCIYLTVCVFLYQNGKIAEENKILVGFYGLLTLFVTMYLIYVFFFKNHAETESEYRKYLISELKTNSISKACDVKESSDKSNETAKQLGNMTNEKRDVIALMINNNDEITEYFRISKSHAKSSYLFSIVASVIGLLFLGIAIYGVIAIKDVQLTIIGAVGGAVTEVVAGLVLWIHNKSAMQLNYYYDALHENEKFLAAINMADKLSEEKREEMYMEIIKKQIAVHKDEKDDKN